MNLDGMITLVHVKGPSEVIGNEELMSKLLDELVVEIGMTPYRKDIVHYPVGSNAEGTITAFVIIQCLYESYIAYDNWPEIGYANFLINSCKPYDVNKIIKLLNERVPSLQIKVEPPSRYGLFVFDDVEG